MINQTQKNNPSPQESSDKPFLRYDDYWLQKGREIVDGSIETLSKRLTALNNYLNYLIGGTFITGTALSTYLKSSKFEVYALVAIAIIAVAIAKFMVGVKGSAPVSKTTDMRSPTQINEDYGRIITKLSKQVNEAAGAVGAATFIALLCMPFAVYFHNCESEKELPKTYLSITDDGSNLKLNGALENAQKVSLTLYGKDSKKKPKNRIYTDLLLQTPGKINVTINLEKLKIKLDSVDVNYSSKNSVNQNTYRFKKENTKAPSVIKGGKARKRRTIQ